MAQELLRLKPSGRARIHQANQDRIKCFVCRDSFARYTCPHCNLRYCSVACFGAASHSTCSESFYKNALLEDMRFEGPSHGPTHSQSRMLEILRNSHADDEALSDEDNSVESIEMTQEQLDRLSKDELLELLTDDQIAQFNRKLASGQIEPEFVEATINSQCQDPWWIACQADHSSSSRPALLDQSLLPPLSEHLNPALFYHILSVALGYVSLIRHYGVRSLSEMGAEEGTEVGRGSLEKFMPVLFGGGDVRVESVAECFGLLLAKVPQIGAASIPFLAQDLRRLFPDSPPNSATTLVAELAPDGRPIPTSSSSNTLCPLALSDLHRFLDHPIHPPPLHSKLRKPILKKLQLFIAFSLDNTRLQRFSAEIQLLSPLDSDLETENPHPHLLPNQLPFSNLLVSSNTSHVHPPATKPPKILETSTADAN